MKKKSIIFFATCATLLIYSCDGTKIEEKATEIKDTVKTDVANELDKLDATQNNEFIKTVAKDNKREIVIGKLASEKATSKEVKSYAKMLVSQHTEANKELLKIAEGKGVEIKDSVDEASENKLKELKDVKGKDFDKKFISGMIEDHEKDIEQFEKRAEKTKDAELKEWIEKTLPHLKHHLSEAQKIDSTLNLSKTKK